MAKDIDYTPKQKAFLEALGTPECNGDLRKAMRVAGYSDATAVKEVVEPLQSEIIKLGETLLAAHAVKASLGLVDALDNPGRPGAGVKISAAKELLDRAGLAKKEQGTGTTVQTQNIFILPAKDQIKMIEGTIVPTTVLPTITQENEEMLLTIESTEGIVSTNG